MNRLLTLLGFIYVSYAIITAHVALERIQSTTTQHLSAQEIYPRGLEFASGTGDTLDLVDEATVVVVRNEYHVIVWSGPNCPHCERFKKTEVPKIKKTGTKVKIKWYDESEQEEGEPPVKTVPTIRVYRKSILIKEFEGFVTAEEVLKTFKDKVTLLK